jgi:hypothetical protein
MLRPRLFFAILLAGILALQVFQQLALSAADPFAPGEEARLARIDRLSVERIAAYKIRHVLEAPRFDVVVLGNSSSLGVQGAYLREFGRAFNLSVPGSSVRMSVGIAELLARADKLPATLVVMAENFDVYTQQVQHMPLRWRWRNAFDDIWAGLTSPLVTWRETARMAARLLKEERDRFLEAFNVRLLTENVATLLGLEAASRSDDLIWRGFNSDGSGSDMRGDRPDRVALQPRPPSGGVLEGYLALDIERLSRLSGHSRIIVYESPVEPNSMAHFAANPDARVSRFREVFMRACREFNLECHPAPMLDQPGAPNRWIDFFHPPADRIGPYVATLLRETKQGRPTIP